MKYPRHEQSKRNNKPSKIADDGKTQQHFAPECDVNRIVERFTQTGEISHLASSPGEYAFATSQNFEDAMFIVSKAEHEFEQLPSKVRAHFQNSVVNFLDAAADESRRSEFEDLGLVEPQIDPVDPAPSETLSEAAQKGAETAPQNPPEGVPPGSNSVAK